MKYYWLACSALLLFLAAQGQDKQPFVLKGEIKGWQEGFVYLSYTEMFSDGGMKYYIDSARSDNGRFTIKGTLTQPLMASLSFDRKVSKGKEGDMSRLFLEPAAMELKAEKGHLAAAKLTGSKTHQELETLNISQTSAMKSLAPLSAEYNKLNNEYIAEVRAKKNTAELEPLKTKLLTIKAQMQPYYQEMEKTSKAFMNEYPHSYLTTALLRNYINYMPLKEGIYYYDRMSVAQQQCENGKAIKKQLDKLRGGSPGNPAYPFTKTDINGQPLSLADFKGKYVLLDFWASWCGPCRAGNPHLKELYAKYKQKGFEIIGISDDDNNPAAWKKAVEQDGIGIWKHVLRGLDKNKGIGQTNPEDTSDHYGVRSLPTKILVDPQGVIIGRYGNSKEDNEAMSKKLLEIFKV